MMGRATRRGPWLPDEDNRLLHLVHLQGPNNWVRISQHMQHRSPKQCRERYHQNLKGSLNHEPISTEEGELIEQLVHEMGKRWAEIARRLGNRSDNAVKNWWNGSMNRRKRTTIQQNLASRGVGPRNGPIPAVTSRQSILVYSRSSSPPATNVYAQEVSRPAFPHSLPTPDRDHPFDLPRLTLPEVEVLPALSQPHPIAVVMECHPLPPPRQLHTPQSSLDYRLVSLECRPSNVVDSSASSNKAVSPAGTDCSNQRAPSLVSDHLSRYSVSPKTVASPRPGLPPPISTSHSYHDHRRRISNVSIASGGKVQTPMDEGYMSALPTSLSFDSTLKRFPFDAPLKSLISPMVERRPEYLLPPPKLSPLAERDNRMNVARLLG
jgi:Myb-like DNA-binding protein FlbD